MAVIDLTQRLNRTEIQPIDTDELPTDIPQLGERVTLSLFEPYVRETDKQQFANEEIEPLATKLINLFPADLSHLRTNRILYLFNLKEMKAAGERIYGKASKASGILHMMTGFVYIVELDLPYWEANAENREPVLLNLLLRCGYDWEKETPVMRLPDCQEFTTVAKHYGFWNAKVQEFGEVLSDHETD